jgi:hypothetical protein
MDMTNHAVLPLKYTLFILVNFDGETISACMNLLREMSEIVKINPEINEF